MQTLALALKNKGAEGEPFPPVFWQLERAGVKFRRGWTHLIVAAPGAGKSALSSFWAQSVGSGEPSGRPPILYFSPDNDKLTWGKGAVAKALGIHVNEAEKRLERGDPEVWQALEENTSHLWVSFQSNPSPRDIREEVDAFAYTYGDWPQAIFIDNLMDIDASGGGPDERTSQDAVIEFLKVLGRDTGIGIFILCHTTGAYSNGNVPVDREGIMNKIDKRPQLVLSLYRESENLLGVCILKNRGGRQAGDASLREFIPWMPELAWFGTGEKND